MAKVVETDRAHPTGGDRSAADRRAGSSRCDRASGVGRLGRRAAHGLVGVGGGYVIVPALTLTLGLDLPTAIGTSLVVITGNAAIALSFRGVETVDWSIAIPFAITTLIGSAVALRLRPTRSLQAFAVLLVAVAMAYGLAAGAAIMS